MRPRRVALLLVCLVVAALWLGAHLREQRNVAGPSAADIAIGDSRDQTLSPAATHPAARTTRLIEQLIANDAPATLRATPPLASPAPLPRWDAKLVDVLPELRARADVGDIPAACHLALALTACAFTHARQASPALLRVLKPDDKDAIDDVARSSVDYLRNGREATCVGVPEAEFEARFHYLRLAADGGSEAAMLAYVEGMPLLSFETMVRHVDWVEQYRLDAPRHVVQLLRNGSRRAALMLAVEGNGFQATPLAQLLQLDARTAATLHQLGQRVRGEPYTVNHLAFTPEQEAVGRGRAEVIFARYFGSRSASAKELRSAADLLDVEACMESR